MADIRINALATTAASTASDDFVAVDGSANGTRKLNAYSPTFGGNLTVSGTGLNVGGNAQTYAEVVVNAANGAGQGGYLSVKSAGVVKSAVGSKAGITGSGTSNNLLVKSFSDAIELDAATTTVSGNLTVSGGTITGGTSGLSLASGGTNQNIALTPSGTGIVSINRGLAASATGTAFVVQTTDASSLSLFAELEGNATSASRYVTLNSYMGGGGGGRNLVLNRYGGNIPLGTTTDGGQKLQVSGTGYVSGRLTTNTGTLVTGGESISTGAGQPIGVQLRYGSVADTAELLAFDWANNGAKNLTLRGTAVTLQTGTYGGTTALTLDSSQNATFAGDVTVSGGNMGVGIGASASIALSVTPSTLTGNTQYGVAGYPVFSSAATAAGYSGYFEMKTAASAFTMAVGRSIFVEVPTMGAGSAITTQSGIYVSNQGAGSITNAYGIDIAAQSGATTTNIGLRNLGATVLATPAAAVTLATNSTMTFELTSNTSLTIKVRGTDGTTRSVALTLA